MVSSICYGVMSVILPGKRSYNDVTGWNRSSIPDPGIQVGGYVENHGIDLFRLAKEKGLEGHNCQAKNQHLPTWKTITGFVED